MTREEAKHIVDVAFDVPQAVRRIGEDRTYQEDEIRKAKEMAIKALEQLTSYEQTINKLTKAISEQEPFNIETYCKEHFCVMVDKDVWEKAEKALEQEPTTHGYMLVCPNCGLDVHSDFKTCPRCGARMESAEC